jgi:hypothetical protein
MTIGRYKGQPYKTYRVASKFMGLSEFLLLLESHMTISRHSRAGGNPEKWEILVMIFSNGQRTTDNGRYKRRVI